MPKHTRTRRVRAIPYHPLCYQVESWEKRELFHQVDLSENGGNGACSCWDYSRICQKNFNDSCGKWVEYGSIDNKNPLRTQCAHIKAARFKFTNDTLKAISEQLNHNPNATT